MSQSTAGIDSPVSVPSPTPTPRTWVRRIKGGGEITETCPSFCTATHAHDQNWNLNDLAHAAPAVAMRVESYSDGSDEPVALPVLAATIMQWPYSEGVEARQPHVSFEPSPDEYIELDADAFAAVIAQIRAHADRLDGVLTQLLAAQAEHGARVH